jgi:hypothetical protein
MADLGSDLVFKTWGQTWFLVRLGVMKTWGQALFFCFFRHSEEILDRVGTWGLCQVCEV